MVDDSMWDCGAATEADLGVESDVEPMQRVMQAVTREHWPGESYYVWAELHPEIPSALFVLDTGAMVSLLNKNVFDEIPERLRPAIRHTGVRLESVKTQAVTTYGIVTLHLDIQGVRFSHDSICGYSLSIYRLQPHASVPNFRAQSLWYFIKHVFVQ